MAAPTQEYLKTKVMTASPEMLTLMLWDGAIRFTEQGKEAIAKREIEGSYKALVRAQRIVIEAVERSEIGDLGRRLLELAAGFRRRVGDEGEQVTLPLLPRCDHCRVGEEFLRLQLQPVFGRQQPGCIEGGVWNRRGEGGQGKCERGCQCAGG